MARDLDRFVISDGDLTIAEEPRQAERRAQLAEPSPVPPTFAEIEQRLVDRARRRQQDQQQ